MQSGTLLVPTFALGMETRATEKSTARLAADVGCDKPFPGDALKCMQQADMVSDAKQSSL